MWRCDVLESRHASLIRNLIDRPYLTALLLGHRTSATMETKVRNLLAAVRGEPTRPAQVSWYPYHYMIDPQSGCNLRCPLCVQTTSRGERAARSLQSDHAVRTIRSIAPYAVRCDLFNWGEPLLNPEFAALAKVAVDAGIFVRTSTNLSLRLTDDAIADIVHSGIHHIVVSIDGATQATYEVYRRRGDLALVLDNLRRLASARLAAGQLFPLLEWQFIAFRHNVGEIPAARNLAAENGCDAFSCGGGGVSMRYKLSAPPAEAFARSKHLLLDPDHPLSQVRADGGPIDGERDGCGWLWGKQVLNADGGLAPCWSSWPSDHDIGSAYDTDVLEAWHGPGYAARRAAALTGTGVAPCASCAAGKRFVSTPDGAAQAWSCADLDDVVASMRAHPQLADGLSPAAIELVRNHAC